MKLTGYILKKIFPIFIGSALFFALILNLVDLFMNISVYLQNNAPVGEILQVMWLYIPKTFWYGIPIAYLFSVAYSLSELYAKNEMEAIFASGVSLFRFTAPVLILSVFISVGLFFFENSIVVPSLEKKVALQNKLMDKTEISDNENIIVLSENSKIVYKAKRYNDSQKQLIDLYIVFRNDDKSINSIIFASSAEWNEDSKNWKLNYPVEYDYINGEMIFTSIASSKIERLSESYEIFRRRNVDIESVNTRDAKIYIDHLRKAGLPYQEQLSIYYKKYAFPLIVFIAGFLAIGLTGKTKKNVLLISLASSISAVVLFYVFQMITMIFAKFGIISPFMGAWVPDIVFTIISIVLLKFART